MIQIATRPTASHHLSSPSSSSVAPPSSLSSSKESRPHDSFPLPLRHLRAPPSPDSSLPEDVVSSSSHPIHTAVTSNMAITEQSAYSANQPPHMHRIRKGQRIEDIQPSIPSALPPLHYIDSPFQLQEYLSLLIRQNPHNVEKIVALPQPISEPSKAFGEDLSMAMNQQNANRGKEKDSGTFSPEEEPQAVDTDIWVYEQLRRIVLDFSTPWLTSLQKECDRRIRPSTCDAMNADDWMYLCASHGEEKQCCAIDYIVHTLDGTTALLNSARHFPSRTYIPTTSLRHFGSVSRRLSRIFVHAYEHHRDVFEACEAETSLYARFIALVQAYDLIAIDNLPKLGRAASSASRGSQAATDLEGQRKHSDDDVFITRNNLPLRSSQADPSVRGTEGDLASDGEENAPGRMLLGRGHLNSAEAADTLSSKEDKAETGARGLGRSDSISSTGTAIHIGGDDDDDGEEAKIYQEAENRPADVDSFADVPARSPGLAPGAGRRELLPEEAPHDAHDEDEDGIEATPAGDTTVMQD